MNGPGASDSPTSVTYALGRDTAEAERLRRQTTELQPLAAELLDRVGAALAAHRVERARFGD